MDDVLPIFDVSAPCTFLKESTKPAETQERAIAQIARAAYDYFVFNPDPR